jgi:hypothetical protein
VSDILGGGSKYVPDFKVSRQCSLELLVHVWWRENEKLEDGEGKGLEVDCYKQAICRL